MSTMLATTNPEAAAREADTRPIPGVGEWVIYYPRPGEVQRGRNRLPALVMATDVDNRLLELVIIRGVDDWLEQTHVPERKGEDRGWERRDGPPMMMVPEGSAPQQGAPPQVVHVRAPQEVAQMKEALENLRGLILGEFDAPPKPVLELIDTLDERMDRVEKVIAAMPPLTAPAQKAAKAAKPSKAQKKAKKRGK